jgi:putative ABC transport system ATP-binding protein
MTLVKLKNVTKTFVEGNKQRHVLKGASTDFFEGEFAVVLGKSGSGKSTMLNLVAGIDEPDSGDVLIAGTNITTLSEHDRTIFRRDNLGIVFQFFNLIPTLTVLENITLPYELRGTNRRQNDKRARALLERVGLPDRAGTFPDKLSGGEQQRVAIARALVHEPRLILADEPTGNLDGDTSDTVLKLLLDLTRELGRTLIMVTHSMEVVPMADRVFRLQHGVLFDDTENVRAGYRMRQAVNPA